MTLPDGKATLVRLCPECGGHLGDTWDEESQECTRCGFRYIAPIIGSYRNRETDSQPSPIDSGKSILTSQVAVVVALFAGMTLANSNMAQTTDGGTIVINGPDAPFWVGGLLLTVAVILIARTFNQGGHRV